MNSQAPKPSPIDDPDQQPYWEAAKRHELALQRCSACRAYVHPPGVACPKCAQIELEWTSVGREVTGVVYSFITVHRGFTAGFQEQTPYVVALCSVDPAPGVRILCNVADSVIDDVAIGRSVEMVWEDRTPALTLPQWRLSG